jgi:hypothetical protein
MENGKGNRGLDKNSQPGLQVRQLHQSNKGPGNYIRTHIITQNNRRIPITTNLRTRPRCDGDSIQASQITHPVGEKLVAGVGPGPGGGAAANYTVFILSRSRSERGIVAGGDGVRDTGAVVVEAR